MMSYDTTIPSSTCFPPPADKTRGRGDFAPAAAVCRSWWLELLCVLLLGYALFGRGWAYFPSSRLFVGEIVLILGLITVFLGTRWSGLFACPPIALLLALAAWGLYRTLPYISAYGAESLRDAMIWAYGAYAVIIVCYIQSDPRRLVLLIDRYRQFCWVFLAGMPVVWIATHTFEHAIPRWPWEDVAMIDAKGGDVLVHLAGILAFFVAGAAGRVGLTRIILLAGSVCVIGAYNRGGFLAVLAVMLLCLLLKPRSRVLWRFTGIIACALVLLAATGVKVSLAGKQRDLSFDQLVDNVASIAADTGNSDLSGTRDWRLEWWSDIYGYTIRGDYFWKGKGFGINLADDDGYQGTFWEERLRSPHNGHMTFLARAGVPGVTLWALTQLSWLGCVGAAFVQSTRQKNAAWSRLFFFTLAYWLACMVNTTFDVYLEGPMGGIWFWSVFGAGLAAASIYPHYPDLFVRDEPDEEVTTLTRETTS